MIPLRPLDPIRQTPLYPGDATPAIHHAALHQGRETIVRCGACHGVGEWRDADYGYWCCNCVGLISTRDLVWGEPVACPYCQAAGVA
jgi:hypothetical protein